MKFNLKNWVSKDWLNVHRDDDTSLIWLKKENEEFKSLLDPKCLRKSTQIIMVVGSTILLSFASQAIIVLINKVFTLWN